MESNDRLNAVLRAAPESIMTISPDGEITLWNEAAERTFGWKNDEIIGKVNPIFPKDKSEEFNALRNRVLQGESFSFVELLREKKDGTLIDISLSTAPLRNTNDAK